MYCIITRCAVLSRDVTQLSPDKEKYRAMFHALSLDIVLPLSYIYIENLGFSKFDKCTFLYNYVEYTFACTMPHGFLYTGHWLM